MLAPNWIELLVLVGTVGVPAAVVVYLALRMFVWSRAKSKSLEHIRNHALWTGIIAWAFSSLAGAGRAGIYDPDRFQPDPWATIPWFSLLAPVVAVIAVHAIGQSTWPAPQSPKRVASLEFRGVRDYIEPALGWTVAGIFTLTAAVVGVLYFVPGFISSNSVILGEYGQSIQTHQGRGPGYVLASALSVALVFLAIGTFLVMRLIASRRSLEALSPDQNKTLRTIGMNRLLRVVATMASGIGAIAGNYLFQPEPLPGGEPWVNALAVVNGAVLIAMLVWKPPFLDATTDDAGYRALLLPTSGNEAALGDGPAAAKFSNSAPAALLPAAAVGAGAGYLLKDVTGGLGIVALAAAFSVLACLALEFVLRRNYAAPGTARSPLRIPLPWPLCAAFGVAAAGLVLGLINAWHVAASVGPNSWDGMDEPQAMFWVPTVAAAVLLAVGLLAARFVLARPGLTDAAPRLDRALRRRSLFRIARTVTGGWYAMLGLLLIMIPVAPDPNPLAPRFESVIFGALCLVIAALVACYPVRAFTPADFVEAPKAGAGLGK